MNASYLVAKKQQQQQQQIKKDKTKTNKQKNTLALTEFHSKGG